MPDDVPRYILTDQGLKSEEELSAVPAVQKKYVLGSPWLGFALFLALAAYFFNSKEWFKAAERYIEKKQNLVALEPYRLWAANNPLAYDEVAASPASFTGKAVVWEISIGAEGQYYCDGQADKKIAWTEGNLDARLLFLGSKPTKVLARIEGAAQDRPLLKFLETF
ncbi:MAG: hypothetical protein HY747_04760 [Elusimicrobia bacterium]|nr:hypothetical protein [Elusimicrobiota bacterium]